MKKMSDDEIARTVRALEFLDLHIRNHKIYLRILNPLLNDTFSELKALCERDKFEILIDYSGELNLKRDVSENLEAFVPLEGVDMSAVIMRLRSQKTKLEKEIAKLSSMLNNEKFVASAPQAVVEANREGLQSAQEKFAKVCDELKAFGE